MRRFGFAYYRHNPRQFLLLFLPVLLCVLLLFLIQTVIASSFSLEYRAFVETRKAYTSIQARSRPIDGEMIEAIRQFEHTDRIAPCVLQFTEIASPISQVGVRIYLLGAQDLISLMSDMDLSLAAGRLPEPERAEIVLHELVAANKGLSIGDSIGFDLDPAERLLGQYTVVGLLRGQALCGFAPIEHWQTQNQISQPQEYGILVFPIAGHLQDLNRFITYLPATGAEISSYEISRTIHEEASGKVYLLLNTIFLAVLLINSLCVGFLTYLFYLGRARELALLQVIGYNRGAVLRHNLLDVLMINLAATLLATGLALLIIAVLNQAVFQAAGMPLTVGGQQAWLILLCIPLAAMIAEILAVNSVFRHLDLVGLLDQDS
jgi:hypothetical protein